MDLHAYMAAAKARQGLSSDMQLAKALAITRTTVSGWRRGHDLPGDELMTRLAALAGENQELALLRLNYWRQQHGRAKALYKELIERLAGASLAIAVGAAVLGAPSPSRAGVQPISADCILRKLRRRSTRDLHSSVNPQRPQHGAHALTLTAPA